MKHNLLLDAGLSLEKEHLVAEKKEKNVYIKHYVLTDKDEKILLFLLMIKYYMKTKKF